MSYMVGFKVFDVTTDYGDLLVTCTEKKEVQKLVQAKYPDVQVYDIQEQHKPIVVPLEGFAE